MPNSQGGRGFTPTEPGLPVKIVIPIMIAAAIGASMPSLVAIGGLQGLLVVVAFSASLGMILPVSTPPNSLAYSTGLIESKDMAKVGLIIGLVGLFIVYGAVIILF